MPHPPIHVEDFSTVCGNLDQMGLMALRAMREASLSRSPGYLNKEIFMLCSLHGAGWEADDRQGPNERTVLFCSISGQTMNLRGETDGLQGQPERPKSVRVFRHLFPADPDIVTGEIDMLPAKRGQMGQQMLGDTFGLA